MADHRFPINIRINGVMYKDNNKMYMTSVLWSDQSEVTVCRSLQDFKEFHKRLKKKFPPENPRERVLPRFGGRMIKMNFQKKTPLRYLHRLRTLEKYCTELLQCAPSVTQASDVTQFFLPREQELNPEFAQNSVMIFQPEDVPNDLDSRGLRSGQVTQPYVTKTYRCVAPYETKDTKNRPFKVAVNETLDVLIKDQAGWWLVENDAKCLAWFPAPFLEMCEEVEGGDDELDTEPVQSSLFCAARSYTAKTKEELSVTVGTVVEVLKESDTGWWFARYNGKTGYVPSMYLHPYTNPMFSLQKKLCSPTLTQPPMTTLLQDTPAVDVSRMPKRHWSEEWIPEGQRCTPVQYHRSNSCTPVQYHRSNSCAGSSSSDSTDFSFHSSSSLGLRLSVFDDEEEQEKTEMDSESENVGSDVCEELPSPTDSEGSRLPRVPPRPNTQEILRRCTTYTRKAALATQSRLFPERFDPNNEREKPVGRY